jgi:hypothetical protein
MSLTKHQPRLVSQARRTSKNDPGWLRSSKLKALKGRSIIARGKRESASAPPRVKRLQKRPLLAKPRSSANLICGILSSNGQRGYQFLVPMHSASDDCATLAILIRDRSKGSLP